MSNSNTEHSRKLRQATMEKWAKENRARRNMNNYASAARNLCRQSTIEELPLLIEIRDMIKNKIKEIKEKNKN